MPASDRYIEKRAALTGVGQSDVARRLGRDPLELTLDACLAAIADAGLEPGDIDGLATYPGGMAPARGFSFTWHRLARTLVISKRIAPMTASVTTAPRKSLALCGRGSGGSLKPPILESSLSSFRSSRRSMRAALPRDLIPGWFPMPA